MTRRREETDGPTEVKVTQNRYKSLEQDGKIHKNKLNIYKEIKHEPKFSCVVMLGETA